MGKKILALLLLFFFVGVATTQADDCANLDIQPKIDCYQRKIEESQGQQKTLAATIAYLDNRMALTAAEIAKTENELKTLEEEISTLTVKISRLDADLTDVSKLLVSRVGAAYKRSLFRPVFMLFASGGLTDFFERTKYLQAAQENDKNVLLQLQTAKDLHQQQKELKEEKQAQAEALRQKLAQQTSALGGQKQSKQQLLEITRNDERNYQNLLAAARAEMAAIQSILAGGGKETEVGAISQGARIATIISGRSACSTGTHLHFEIGENKKNVNPANYLKSVDVSWDLCGWWPDCDSPFSFTGSWDWPVNGQPRITQGYGMTGYARSGAYSGGPHTGIDMVSDDLAVKAVKPGTLYQGTIGCGGGILRYVKVEHQGANTETYYLHVNY